MRSLLLITGITGSMSLMACSAYIQRPVKTTDAATQMEQVTHSQVNEFDPAISPDATAIAYDVAATQDALPHVEVMALKDVGSGKQKVEYSSKDTMGLEPTWMPDGSGLIFVSKTRGAARGLVQTFGPGPHQTNFLADAGDPYLNAEWPTVSPDGKTMAMALPNIDSFHTGWQSGWRTAMHLDRALGVSDLMGTGTTMLGSGSDPSYSPDGAFMAFSRATSGHAHLFVVNADGNGAHQITDGSSEDIEPSWSPDGKYIVFCAAHGDDHWTQANLFAIRPDGSGLVQVTEGDRIVCRPRWARDGFVYFHANVTDRFHIWRVRPVGQLTE